MIRVKFGYIIIIVYLFLNSNLCFGIEVLGVYDVELAYPTKSCEMPPEIRSALPTGLTLRPQRHEPRNTWTIHSILWLYVV